MSASPYFTITGKLHEGTNTVLHRAYRNADHAPVVVKVPKGERPSQRELAKLRHEYNILSSLQVPGVVKAYAIEKHNSGLALVLEDLPGETIAQRVSARSLDISSVLTIMIRLAEIIDGIHKQNCIHKDIKSENILVRADNDVYLIDFGIATQFSQETLRALSPDTLEGTLAYMSPEQTGRMSRVIDYRTDFYSLGVTFYEMLVGELPFLTTDLIELVHSHIARQPVPPHVKVQAIPEPISDIIMKLMAKTPEERYQSGWGLKVDLEECRRQWESTGQIAKFPLGQKDYSAKLCMPQRLYGRAAERIVLTAAIGRVAQSGAETIFITGPSGIGKTALLQAVESASGVHKGYFIADKFEPVGRSAPFRPITQAFRALLRQVLSERAESLRHWRERLKRALDANGRLICDLIPELELIIGEQPHVVPVGPSESERRFHLVFQNFVRACCQKDRPLLLFLDDLQSADPASLKLLQALIGDPERQHILFVGAYRDEEVAPGQPLTLMIEELRKSAVAVTTLALQPLAQADIGELLSDCLGSRQDIDRLSQIVLEKTHGNPFFIGQFLNRLQTEGLLKRDTELGTWLWEPARVHQLTVTANVVPFMLEKVQRLPPATQRALELASCIGPQFDLPTLALLSEQTAEKTAADLWEALREALIIAVNIEHRGPVSSAASDLDAGADFKSIYQFAHDRVRQVAYSLLEEGKKREAHLQIGRWLLLKSEEQPQAGLLFDTLNHLNLGAALITSPKERMQLAQRNLAAGIQAKATSAYAAAAEYFAAGMAMLTPTSWESDYQTSFSLYVQRLECEYLSGNCSLADKLVSDVLASARSDIDRAQVYDLQVSLYTTLGKLTEALAVARTGLAMFGIKLPESGEEVQATFAGELALIPQGLAGRQITELREAPTLENPAHEAALRLLMNSFVPAFAVNPALPMLIAAKQVNLSLRHGHCNISAFGYAAFGMLQAAVFGSYREAYEFGSLALALNERFGNVSLLCRLTNLHAGFIHIFCRPLRSAISLFEKANQAGLETGDFSYLSFNCAQITLCRLSIGDELPAVQQEAERFLTMMKRTREVVPTCVLTSFRQLAANLQAQTRGPQSLSDESFDEEAFVATLQGPTYFVPLYYHYQVKAQVHYLQEDYAQAWAIAQAAEPLSPFAVGSYMLAEASFYICLILAALYPEATEAARTEYMATIEQHRAKLGRWAESGPENFQHKYLLVSAEVAQLTGKPMEAMALYDEAIAQARKSEFINHEGLANELAARFYLRLKRQSIAALYMGNAHYSYQRWGATAKVTQLAEKYGQLLSPETIGSPGGLAAQGSVDTTSTRIGSTHWMDVTAVLRAAQSIASELMVDKVIEQLMRSVLQNAGAQHGFLILKGEEELFIEASMSLNPETIQVGLHMPLSAQPALARSIVQYVIHTREPVVLGDAALDKRFGSDPHIAAHRLKSVLCLALIHQGRLTGVLYLENNLANHAFTTNRVELLQLLSSQAAIAVENARLYEHVEAVTVKLRRSNEELTVANERLQAVTDQLQQSNLDLSSVNRQLQIELKERAAAETQRAALQEEIIRVQSSRLAEMSTPLIPITDRIMVMPLIGTMDNERAGQVLETALQGAQKHSTQVIIIDITGMKHFDTSVAGTLISTAAALRLLGTQAILTGIRAEVAQTLVGLGINLEGIVTRSTLQSGILYAINRVGDLLSKHIKAK